MADDSERTESEDTPGTSEPDAGDGRTGRRAGRPTGEPTDEGTESEDPSGTSEPVTPSKGPGRADRPAGKLAGKPAGEPAGAGMGPSESPKKVRPARRNEEPHQDSCFRKAGKPRSSRVIQKEKEKLYADASFLTISEVHLIGFLAEALDTNLGADNNMDSCGEEDIAVLDGTELQMLPEFIFNPFTHRILRVFDQDGSETLTVDELLDVFSVFSPRASVRAKAQAAFNIYDYDEDGELSAGDIEHVLQKMLIVPFDSLRMGIAGDAMTSRIAEVSHGRSPEEALTRLQRHIKVWAQRMVEEMDTTATGSISYDEWEEGITNCADFKDFFSMKVASKKEVLRAKERLREYQERKSKLNVESRFGSVLKQHETDKRHKNYRRKKKQKSEVTTYSNPLEGSDGEEEQPGGAEATEATEDQGDIHGGKDAAEGSDTVDSESIEAARWACDEIPMFKSIAVTEQQKGGEFVDKFVKLLGEKMQTVSFKPKQTVMSKGQAGNSMYIITSGKVGIFRNKNDRQPIDFLERKDLCGIRAIITGAKVGAFYIATEATTAYMLSDIDLGIVLQEDSDAAEIFNAGPEIRLANRIRMTKHRYSTPHFPAPRPPPLHERVKWLHDQQLATEEENQQLAEMTAARGAIKATKGAGSMPLELVAKTLNIADDTLDHAIAPLWQHRIDRVQSKFGSGVSTTFMLQRWIGMQNMKVFLVWLALVIVPRQLSLYLKWELEAGKVGVLVPDTETAIKYRDAALGNATGELRDFRGNRDFDVHMHSGYAPAMGSDPYMQNFSMAYGLCVVIIYLITIRSLVRKLRDVTAGNEVLGSGTESVAGIVSKTEGYFGALAMYDFGIRDPISVATMQDGIYSHLEMLTENEIKSMKEETQSVWDSIRIWIGWLLYLVLMALMGVLIFLILSEFWLPEECCACGCQSCAQPELTNANASLHPDFCNAATFNCESCSKGKENPLNSATPFLRPLLLSLTTAVIPFLVKKIAWIERRHDIGEEMKVTLIRVFSLKMFNIALMFLDLHKVAEEDKRAAEQLEQASGGAIVAAQEFTCLEDKLGSLFRRMVVTDALVYTMIVFFTSLFVKYFRNGERMEYDSIKAAQEVINVMYRQVVTWVATVTSPMMPILTFCISNCLMAVEFWSLNSVYRPPEHPWSSVKTVTSFMALTFLSMLVSLLPNIVWMTGVRMCGPFKGIRPVDAPEVFFTNLIFDMSCHDLEPGMDCAELSREPCMKRAALGECEWRVSEVEGGSIQSALKKLQLVYDIGTTPVFLLGSIAIMMAIIYFMKAHIERWRTEVAALQSNSETERKFLVQKLRDMHTELGDLKGHTAEEHEEYVKKGVTEDLRALNETRNDSGGSAMATSAEDYHEQHLETKGMSRTEKVKLDKEKLELRQEEEARSRTTALSDHDIAIFSGNYYEDDVDEDSEESAESAEEEGGSSPSSDVDVVVTDSEAALTEPEPEPDPEPEPEENTQDGE